MNRLENKVAVVTGGNSGIGLAAAKAFIKEGAKVVILGRNEVTLNEARQTLGENAIAVQGDITNNSDLDNLYARTVEQFGKIDVLFANAGVAAIEPFEAVTEETLDYGLDVNIKGTFNTVQRALAALNDNSSVILTTSGASQQGIAGTAIYAASKAAVRSFARTFSADLIERGIRVNAISPGPVSTPMFGRIGLPPEMSEGLEGQLVAQVPIKRGGEPEEIANAVVFLASDESSYIVGVELAVDGGLTQL